MELNDLDTLDFLLTDNDDDNLFFNDVVVAGSDGVADVSSLVAKSNVDENMKKSEQRNRNKTRMQKQRKIEQELVEGLRQEAGGSTRDETLRNALMLLKKRRIEQTSPVLLEAMKFIGHDPTPAALVDHKGFFRTANKSLLAAWKIVDEQVLHDKRLSEKFCAQRRGKVEHVLKRVLSLDEQMAQMAVECKATQEYYKSIGTGYKLMFFFSPLMDGAEAVGVRLALVPVMLSTDDKKT